MSSRRVAGLSYGGASLAARNWGAHDGPLSADRWLQMAAEAARAGKPGVAEKYLAAALGAEEKERREKLRLKHVRRKNRRLQSTAGRSGRRRAARRKRRARGVR